MDRCKWKNVLLTSDGFFDNDNNPRKLGGVDMRRNSEVAR